jgi:MFS family permease
MALSNRNIVVLSVSVSILMFSFSLYQSFWPVYLLEQGLDVDLVALLSVIGMSSRLLAQLPGGMLADRIGRKKALLIAAPLFVVQPIIYLFASSWEHFVIGQIVGASMSLATPAYNAVVLESLPKGQKGLGYGVFRMILSFSGIFTGIGGIIIDTLGLVQGVNICLIIQTIVSVAFCSIIGLFLNETLQKGAIQKSNFITSIREIFPHYKKNMVALQIASSASQFAMQLLNPFLVIYIIKNVGLSYTEWGLLLSIQTVITIITAIPGGMIADKVDRRYLICFARAMVPLTNLSYIFLRSFYPILLIRVIAGIGAGLGGGAFGFLGGPAWQSLLADLVPQEKRGRIMGLMGTLTGITNLPAAPIGAYMWQNYYPELTFYASMGLGMLSLPFIFFFVKEPRKKKNVEEEPFQG